MNKQLLLMLLFNVCCVQAMEKDETPEQKTNWKKLVKLKQLKNCSAVPLDISYRSDGDMIIVSSKKGLQYWSRKCLKNSKQTKWQHAFNSHLETNDSSSELINGNKALYIPNTRYILSSGFEKGSNKAIYMLMKESTPKSYDVTINPIIDVKELNFSDPVAITCYPGQKISYLIGNGRCFIHQKNNKKYGITEKIIWAGRSIYSCAVSKQQFGCENFYIYSVPNIAVFGHDNGEITIENTYKYPCNALCTISLTNDTNNEEIKKDLSGISCHRNIVTLKTNQEKPGSVCLLAFNNVNPLHLAAAEQNRIHIIKFFEQVYPEPVQTLVNDHEVMGLAYDKSGKLLATSSDAGIQLYGATNEDIYEKLLRLESDFVKYPAIEFNPQDDELAAAGKTHDGKGMLIFWNVKKLKEDVKRLNIMNVH